MISCISDLGNGCVEWFANLFDTGLLMTVFIPYFTGSFFLQIILLLIWTIVIGYFLYQYQKQGDDKQHTIFRIVLYIVGIWFCAHRRLIPGMGCGFFLWLSCVDLCLDFVVCIVTFILSCFAYH